MHVRDLNFVLRSKIFVHFDGQLRVSHHTRLRSCILYLAVLQPIFIGGQPPTIVHWCMASQFPPPSSHSRKRQRTTEQPPKVSGDAPSRTPRPRVFGGIQSESLLVTLGQLPRLGLIWRPPFGQKWAGRPPLGLEMSPFLWQLASKLGRKAKVGEFPEAWHRVSFCLRTCTFSRVELMDH